MILLALIWIAWFTLSFWESLSVTMLVAAVSDQQKLISQERKTEACWRLRVFSAQWRAFFGAAAFGSVAPLVVSDLETAFSGFVLILALCLTAILAIYSTLTVAYSPLHALNRKGFIRRMVFTWICATSLSIGAYLLIAFILGRTPEQGLLGHAVVVWSIGGAVLSLGKGVLDAAKSATYPIFGRPFTFEEMRAPGLSGEDADTVRPSSTQPERTG
jgi:hypothetical protein